MAKKSVAKRNVKKVIQTFSKMAAGLVKLWLVNKKGVNSPYIVAVDQVDEFVKQITEQ